MILNLLCILAFFCLPLPAQNPEKGAAHALRCLWSFDQEQNDCLLQLPEHFFVSTLTYSCDVPFERDELLALLGFDEGQLVAREQLLHALESMRYKEKFERVILYFDPLAQPSFCLHCAFSSWWTVAKVHCKGSLLGKDRYRHHYRMGPGARFDTIKHQDSLAAMYTMFTNEGYAGAQIIDEVVYDEERKTVAITLNLDAGQLYTINNVQLEIQPDTCPEHAVLVSKFKKILFKELYGTVCSQIMLQQAEDRIEELCTAEGFLQPEITVKCHYDHDKKKQWCCSICN